MNFQGFAAPLSPNSIRFVQEDLNVDLPAIWAVLSVETSGCGFLDDRRPKILFERHVFHKLTGGRFSAAHPGISNAVAGDYGASGAFQYWRLAQAMALAPTEALDSASWGLGQVMGFNATMIGYRDVGAMIESFLESEDQQIMAMMSFIQARGLARALHDHQWDRFAAGYNGAGYAAHDYHGKLARYHAQYTTGPLPDLTVRTVQMALIFAKVGNVGGVDGWFGRKTQDALLAFQASRGLPLSGQPDDATLTELKAPFGWP